MVLCAIRGDIRRPAVLFYVDAGAICCLKNTGMPLKQSKEFTDCQHAGDGMLRDRRAMLRRHRQAVLNRIEELRQNLEAIDRKLAYYDQACAAYGAGRPVPPCGCGAQERD